MTTLTTLKKILIPFVIVGIIGFVLFLINQISGIYFLVRSQSEFAADVTLYLLSGASAILLFWPIVLFLKLPASLQIPTKAEDVPAYQQRLIKRLRRNESLKSARLIPKSREELPAAMKHLDELANREITETAKMVFLTTSVSQNGRLDALTILITQSKMIWNIAHNYYQRPSLRELSSLYLNVAGTAFVASELEDLDISQQIEPVITSMIKNAGSQSIPIIGPAASIVFDSLLEGSANAFLTLRVGIITRRYCGNIEVFNSKSIKSSAFKEAAVMLKGVVLQSSGSIISGILAATKKAGLDTLKNSWEGVKNTSQKVVDSIKGAGQKLNPFSEKSNEIID